jgi:hypothetical protein
VERKACEVAACIAGVLREICTNVAVGREMRPTVFKTDCASAPLNMCLAFNRSEGDAPAAGPLPETLRVATTQKARLTLETREFALGAKESTRKPGPDRLLVRTADAKCKGAHGSGEGARRHFDAMAARFAPRPCDLASIYSPC